MIRRSLSFRQVVFSVLKNSERSNDNDNSDHNDSSTILEAVIGHLFLSPGRILPQQRQKNEVDNIFKSLTAHESFSTVANALDTPWMTSHKLCGTFLHQTVTHFKEKSSKKRLLIWLRVAGASCKWSRWDLVAVINHMTPTENQSGMSSFRAENGRFLGPPRPEIFQKWGFCRPPHLCGTNDQSQFG